jgi:hypothetical protein
MDARLDAMTQQNVDDLAPRVHQPRAAVLSQIMPWGLSREYRGTREHANAQGPVHHLYLYVTSDFHT